jgi:hypothetical protein
MIRLTSYQLSWMYWTIGTLGFIILIWQWPSSSQGCHAFTCTYLPLPAPSNGCYWIVPDGHFVADCVRCQCESLHGQTQCQTFVNGTVCYNGAGDSEISENACADFTTCHNLARVLARVLVGTFGGLFIGLMMTCLCAMREVPSAPGESEKLIPLRVLTSTQPTVLLPLELQPSVNPV